MHIDNLPDDILVIIFDIIVFNQRLHRKLLLLTSKRWHAVATSYAPLWTNVAWRWAGNGASNRILCSNLRSLSQVIQRAGTAPLDLYFCAWSNDYTDGVIREFIASVPDNWTSFCQSLRLDGENTSGDEKAIKLFGSARFEQLEQLDLYGQLSSDVESGLMRLILMSVDATSTNLRSLRTDNIANASKYPTILRRLENLNLSRNVATVTIPWQYLSELEKLTFSGSMDLNENALFTLPRVSLLQLKVRRSNVQPTSRFLSVLGARLTHLTLVDVLIPMENTLSFPNLRHLSIFHTGHLNYGMILAPKLSELVFWYPYGSRGDCLEMATFRPIQVVVNINPSSFLAYKGFFKAISRWTQLEELHIRMDCSSRAYACLKAIIDNLKDQSHLKLRCLSILYDESEENEDRVPYPGMDRKPKLLLQEAGPALSHIRKMMIGRYSKGPPVEWRSQWISESIEDRRVDWTECVRAE